MLDWAGVLARLGPVRHKWDVAILANLAEGGMRSAELLAAINEQAAGERRLTKQVLSLRLRELEQHGYVRHTDITAIPLVRVYLLQPPGRDLVRTLWGLDPWDESQPDRRETTMRQ